MTYKEGGSKREEQIVTALSHGIAALLAENPLGEMYACVG